MEFEWDERKRESVLRKRGIDFSELAPLLFDGRPVLTYPSPRAEEERNVSVGIIERRFYAVVWVWRGTAIRIVTARRAHDEEERQYRSLFGR